MAILLDFFDGEVDCERRARSLSRQLGLKLGGIGSGGQLLLRNKTSWSLTEKQVGDTVADILAKSEYVAWEEQQIAIEEACGERPDLLRQAPLVETVNGTRLMN